VVGWRTDTAAYCLAAVFVVFLILFGWRFHVIEELGSAEMDGFVGKADQLRSGELPRDPYRPLLYPMLAAGAGAILHDSFAGARVISSLFAGLFVLMSYMLGRRCFGRGVGLFTAVALVCNFYVITMGMNASTDAMYAAFVLLTLSFAILVNENHETRYVVFLSLFFALASFTRYVAVFLLPTVILSIVWRPEMSRGRRLRDVALFGILSIVFLVPHFVLTAKQFGSPFYNENWKNLAFKLYGGGDWTYFERIPFDGLLSVIVSSPGMLITTTVRELVRFFNSTLVFAGGKGLAGGLFAAGSLAGLFQSFFSLNRKRALLLSFLTVHVVLSCTFFMSGVRFMLPVLPLLYYLCGSFILSDLFSGVFRLGQFTIKRTAPVIVFFFVFLLLTTVRHMGFYINAHPLRELEAARTLEERRGTELVVLGTFPFMQRYVDYEYYELADAHGEERSDAQLYYRRLKDVVDENKADYIIIGRLTLRRRPIEMLKMSCIPQFLEPEWSNEYVVVYKVLR
jgi:hypothetical protein